MNKAPKSIFENRDGFGVLFIINSPVDSHKGAKEFFISIQREADRMVNKSFICIKLFFPIKRIRLRLEKKRAIISTVLFDWASGLLRETTFGHGGNVQWTFFLLYFYFFALH